MKKGFLRSVFRKKETDSPFGAMAKQMAVSKPSVRIDYMKEVELLPAIRAYLNAVYTQNIDALPMEKMTQGFFYRAQDLIAEDLHQNGKRILSGKVSIDKSICKFVESDAYSVNHIACEVQFFAQGFFLRRGERVLFGERRRVFYRFIRDERMGWQIDGEEELQLQFT